MKRYMDTYPLTGGMAEATRIVPGMLPVTSLELHLISFYFNLQKLVSPAKGEIDRRWSDNSLTKPAISGWKYYCFYYYYKVVGWAWLLVDSQFQLCFLLPKFLKSHCLYGD